MSGDKLEAATYSVLIRNSDQNELFDLIIGQ